MDRLKRRHGGSLANVLADSERMRAELGELESPGDAPEELARRLAAALDGLRQAAADLTAARRRAASRLTRRIRPDLEALGLAGARLQIVVEPLGPPPNGPLPVDALSPDDLSFRLAANPGEDPKPLAKVASGGELSRVMLVLKGVLARADDTPTIVFDEVDLGIGGLTAERVGSRLSELADARQVLVITHLPQIARFAGRHVAVRKVERGGRAAVTVAELDGEARVREIARMLGGGRESRRHAEAMLEDAGVH
jgi:DNA repair protein RecN (Recombination protein N)